VIVDITETIRAQEAEREKFQRSIRELLYANPDALCAFSVNLTRNTCGESHGISAGLRAMLQADTVDELFGKCAANIPEPKERAGFLGLFRREYLIAEFDVGRTSFQTEYERKDENGKMISVRTFVNMLKNPETGDVQAAVFSRDITREKLHDRILQIIMSQEYDLIFLLHRKTNRLEPYYFGERLPAAYSVLLPPIGTSLDASQFCSAAAERWVEPEEREQYLRDTDPAYFIPQMEAEGHYEIMFKACFADGPDGVQYRKVQHYFLDREHETILVVESDVTNTYRRQQRELEEERLLRREAMAASAAKSEFLSRMSHDIRTPLNGIIGMTYLAREEANPEKTADCLAKIDMSSHFLLGLINDVLDMSRAESNKITLNPEPYTLEQLKSCLDAVIQPLCAEKHQHFILDTQPALKEYIPLADKLRTNQILFNLLSNAVKFTPEGGTITHRIRGQMLPDGRMRVDHEISDNGIGIGEEFQKSLFQPFSQEKRDESSEEHGSGLGLAIVKKLVDLMGGEITVRSRIGEGSTFHLYLIYRTIPAEQAGSRIGNRPEEPAEYAEQMEEEVAQRWKDRHILVCEDQPLNQEIIRRLLEQKGVSVSIAADGQQGLAQFTASEPGWYDLILMDIRMPVMNGFDTVRAIRALPRTDAAAVPVIAMTADAFTEDVRRCLDAGMNGHIAKPVEPELLYRVLGRFLNQAEKQES